MPHPRSPARLAGRAPYSAFSNRYSIPTMVAEGSKNATLSNSHDNGTSATSTQEILDASKNEEEEEPNASVGVAGAPSAVGTSGFTRADDDTFPRTENHIIADVEGDASGRSGMSPVMRKHLEATEEKLKASDERLAAALMTVEKLEELCKVFVSTSTEQASRIEQLEGALYEHVQATEARLSGVRISPDSQSMRSAEAGATRDLISPESSSCSPRHHRDPHQASNSNSKCSEKFPGEMSAVGKGSERRTSTSLAAFVACLDDTMDRKMGCVVDALTQRAEQAHALAAAQHDATAARVVNLLHRMDGLDRRFDAMSKLPPDREPQQQQHSSNDNSMAFKTSAVELAAARWEASTCIADLDRRLARIETWQQKATTTTTSAREQKQRFVSSLHTAKQQQHVSFADSQSVPISSNDNSNHVSDHSSSSSSINSSSSSRKCNGIPGRGSGSSSSGQEHFDSGREGDQHNSDQSNSSEGNASAADATTVPPVDLSPDLDTSAAGELMTGAALRASAVDLQAAAAAASSAGVTPSAAVLAALAAAENVTGSAAATSSEQPSPSSKSSGAATSQMELGLIEGDDIANSNTKEEVHVEDELVPNTMLQGSSEREQRADKASSSSSGNSSEERPRRRNAHNDRPATNSAGRVTDPKSPGARLLMRRVTRSPKFV